MGLGGPRNRRKLAHDPNNTKWSRDETTFGQRILRSQGWEPGKFLGAQGSSHADLHTAASSAPIKVVLKDDTLGLGAKIRQKQSTECTGLDGFKDLLGRLNGKSEDVIDKERQLRNDIKTSLYIERRFGTMRFVSGGLLVGDQIQDLVKTVPATLTSESVNRPTSEATEEGEGRESKKAKKEKKSKKRKAEESDPADATDISREKKRKKSSKKENAEDRSDDSDPKVSTKERKKSKKSKDNDEGEDDGSKSKRKKDKKSKSSKEKSNTTREHGAEQQAFPGSDDSSSREKEEKKRRKKEKKEKKRLEKENAAAGAISTGDSTSSDTTPAESGTSTPNGTGMSAPQASANRHHVRGRYIASKRLALADMQALNQIFMIKAV